MLHMNQFNQDLQRNCFIIILEIINSQYNTAPKYMYVDISSRRQEIYSYSIHLSNRRAFTFHPVKIPLVSQT